MGLSLGIPNDSVATNLGTSTQLIIRRLPDNIRNWCLGAGNKSLFNNPDEETIQTFFTSLIDNHDKKYSGWGLIESDGDIITTIHYIIPHSSFNETYIKSIYENLKELFIERYGAPDKPDTSDGFDAGLQNTLCYWNFYNDQRITLNMCESSSAMFEVYERVEIVYQDLKAVNRHKEKVKAQAKARASQRKQAEEKRKKENCEARGSQQL